MGDGRLHKRNPYTLHPSQGLEHPAGAQGFRSGELLLGAPHKHFGHLYRAGSFRRPMQLLAKRSLPKAGAPQGEHELKIMVCTI